MRRFDGEGISIIEWMAILKVDHLILRKERNDDWEIIPEIYAEWLLLFFPASILVKSVYFEWISMNVGRALK